MIGYGQMAQKTFIKNKQDKKPLKTVNINLEIEKKDETKRKDKAKIRRGVSPAFSNVAKIAPISFVIKRYKKILSLK